MREAVKRESFGSPGSVGMTAAKGTSGWEKTGAELPKRETVKREAVKREAANRGDTEREAFRKKATADDTPKKEAARVGREVSLSELLLDNREYLYPMLFYLSGLFIGAFLYHADSPLGTFFQNEAASVTASLLTLFINRFALYMSVYTLTVLLGMCLIGFPFIHAVPLVTGVAVALKASYYYVTYPVKGVGFALLMLAPEAAAFVTLLIFTIRKSRELSRCIYALTVKKTDMTGDFTLSSYLKSFALYVPAVAAIAFVNAAAVHLIGAVIKL